MLMQWAEDSPLLGRRSYVKKVLALADTQDEGINGEDSTTCDGNDGPFSTPASASDSSGMLVSQSLGNTTGCRKLSLC